MREGVLEGQFHDLLADLYEMALLYESQPKWPKN
jgi:hypothetical protein